MSLLPDSIPRATRAEDFYEEPLGFLARSQSDLGNLFVIREGGPILSRAPDCAGAVAVFGPALYQAVLSDIELFGMPESAARKLLLPENLVNLNRGLHSMRGSRHTEHRRLLMRVLGDSAIEDHHGTLTASIERFIQGWPCSQAIGLLGQMRRLALDMSTGLLLGDHYRQHSALADLLQRYFHVRRDAASPFNEGGEESRQELTALGTSVDDALRRYVRWCRDRPPGPSDSVLMTLAGLELAPGLPLGEDEMIAHCNVLFMSGNEPIAVALTWILLILSQLPALGRVLRAELGEASLAESPPTASTLGSLRLLDAVVNESLRLLTPNALMVRVTTRETRLNGVVLPAGCELVLCPFLAHRDPIRFPQPELFLPSRWNGSRPSPFEYMPFGGGGHYCVGSHLAIYMIKATLATLLPRYDLVLAGDQSIDWRIHIMLMPRNEPIVFLQEEGTSDVEGGKLLGPVGELINLERALD